MKNSTILRRAALGPAPHVNQQFAGNWVGRTNALIPTLHLFPARNRARAAFASMTEPEIRLALLFAAASEESEGR